jgi:hypothetical protein
MRLAHLVPALAVLAGLSTAMIVPPAQAQGCTGANCPPPDSQSGRDCESKKSDKPIS